MEDFEAELETLESGAKRSKKPPARVAHYRESLERCAWVGGYTVRMKIASFRDRLASEPSQIMWRHPRRYKLLRAISPLLPCTSRSSMLTIPTLDPNICALTGVTFCLDVQVSDLKRLWKRSGC